MTNNYLNSINARKEKENLKECVIFGQTIGLIIILVSLLKFLTINASNDKYIIILMAIGLGIFLLGLIFPYVLYYPNKIFKYLVNKIFLCCFLIILSIIYLVLIIPIGLFNRQKYQKKYGFYSWNDKSKIKFKQFTDKEVAYLNVYQKSTSISKFKIINQVISYFINSKEYMLIPTILIFILLGVIFYFVTSSVVAPMLYTLF